MEREIDTANVQIIDSINKIHSFTKEDFLETTLPYDFLYGFHKDKFKFEQYKRLLAIQSKEVNICGFLVWTLLKHNVHTVNKELCYGRNKMR